MADERAAGGAAPPEQADLELRLRLHERGLELMTTWLHALREKIEALDGRLRERTNEPLRSELERLRSEIGLLHGYLRASGLRAPEAPGDAPARAAGKSGGAGGSEPR